MCRRGQKMCRLNLEKPSSMLKSINIYVEQIELKGTKQKIYVFICLCTYGISLDLCCFAPAGIVVKKIFLDHACASIKLYIFE